MSQYSVIRNKVLLLTVLVIFGGLTIPNVWIESHIIGFAIVLILGGIPHGASDYLIFRQILNSENFKRRKLIFILYYCCIIAAYGLLWWVYPLIAFSLFILISIYHFGQSNWQYARFPNVVWEKFSFLLWGSLVIALPVLIYYKEAALIIEEITGQYLHLESFRSPVIFLILATNFINTVYLFEHKAINKEYFQKELVNLVVLTALFASTPLLVGFGIYFVFWHALGAVLDQINMLKKFNQHYSFRQYVGKLIPLSLLAFAGLALLYWALGSTMNNGANIGLLFLFISLITVPHSFLIDQLYLLKPKKTREKNNVLTLN